MANVKGNVFKGLQAEKTEEKQERTAPERGRREVITEYEIDKISPSEENTFSQNKDAQYEELKASIAAEGIYEPIKIYNDPENAGSYLIFSGHRRFTAAKELGLKKVPCVLIKGSFTPAEINEKLFAFNQGKRGDDPFGKARSVKKLLEVSKLGPKESEDAFIEKTLHIPHGRSVSRLTSLAKLDNDILVLGQLNLFSADTAEALVDALKDKPELLASTQDNIRSIYNEENDFDTQKAAIKKCIQAAIKKPKEKGQKSPAVIIKHMQKSMDELTTIDFSGDRPKRKAALKASLMQIREMIDEKIKELE